MFFKVVHNKQVHIFNPKDKASFVALINYIKDVFKQLPSKFQLYYVDQENDQITLANQNDFKIMQETSSKTVKIYIKQVNEDFYDQTQKVVLDDQMESLEQKMNQIHIESQEENVQPEIVEDKIQEKRDFLNESQFSSSQISQITEVQIQEKFKQMLPEFIGKVKQSLLKDSSIKSEAPQKEKIQEKVVHHHITCDECQKRNIQGIRYKCAVCADFDLCEDCEASTSHDHPFLKIRHPKQAPYKIIAIVNDQEQNSFQVNGQRVQLPQVPFINNIFEAFCGPRQPRSQNCRFPSFNRGHCPFSNKSQRKCEKKQEKEQEKVEKISQPEKKVKVEEKVEQKPFEKKPIFEQPKPVVEQKKVVEQRKIQQQKPVERTQEQKLMQSANYISGILDIDYNRCYKFASKNPSITKEELLDLYFVNPRQL